MGEYADYEIDRQMGFGDSPFGGRRKRVIVECKFCGAKGLRWKNDAGRWRLAEYDGEYHDCPRLEASRLAEIGDDFEVLD